MAGRLLFSLLLAFILSGCGTTPVRKPLPPELTNQAVIPDIPDARFWGDEWPEFSMEIFENLKFRRFCQEQQSRPIFPAVGGRHISLH